MAKKLFTNLWRRDLKKEIATVGLIDSTWTPILDAGEIDLAELPVAKANSCAQIVGLVGVATWNGYDVSNGNVAVFNTDGELVAVLGSVPSAP